MSEISLRQLSAPPPGSPNGSNDPSNAPPRIPQAAFLGVIIAVLVFSICAAALRTYWRVRLYKTMTASDWLLIVTCLIVVIANSLTCFFSRAIEQGQWNRPARHDHHDGLPKLQPDVLGQVLAWIAVFASKGGFLAFFKQIVSGVRRLEIYWWAVTMFTMLCGVAILLVTFLLSDQIQYLIIITVLDIMTDALLVTIPIRLLWNLQKRLSRKLAAGSLLCVSVVMIIIAILRVAGAHASGAPPDTLDLLWLMFWTAMESNIAVVMLSLTAVKTVFSRNHRDSGGCVRQDEVLAALPERNNRLSRDTLMQYDATPTTSVVKPHGGVAESSSREIWSPHEES